MCGPIDPARDCFYVSCLDKGSQGGIWRCSLDDPERREPIHLNGRPDRKVWALDLDPTGERLLVRLSEGGRYHLARLDLGTQEAAEPIPLAEVSALSFRANYSPDGSWVGYTSNEMGRTSVMLRRVREDGSLGTAIPVPLERPLNAWGADWSPQPMERGQRLLFQTGDGRLSSIDVLSEPGIAFESERVLAEFEQGQLEVFHGLHDGSVLVLLAPEGSYRFDRVDLILDALIPLE
jgi:hypothetical protein